MLSGVLQARQNLTCPRRVFTFQNSSRPSFRPSVDFPDACSNLGGLNVLIIPDKFKGTLAAAAAAEAIARGWLQVRPGDTLTLLPMTDGGDGFGEVMGRLAGAEVQEVQSVDAAHRPCRSRWWLDPLEKTAIIDSSAVIGLAMLPQNQFHPFELDTFGLGGIIKAAARGGAAHCLVGVGGSATNDAGFGLARALGWGFLDDNGKTIERWTDLTRLSNLAAPANMRFFETCRVAVDVQNPLLGPQGATRVYGPQKGLRPRDFELAERCLERVSERVRRQFGSGFDQAPGAGAAGGLGFGFLSFVGASLEPGFDLFASRAKLEARLQAADLVITGEGAIDCSTLMGKGVGRVGRRCRELRLPCVALAGRVDAEIKQEGMFTEVGALSQVTSLDRATAEPAVWLERLASEMASRLGSGLHARDR